LEERLNPKRNKSGRIWHCWIDASRASNAAHYAWRVEGRHDPDSGFRFDPEKILLDPFAPAVHFPPNFNRIACGEPGPSDARAPLGVLPRSAPPAPSPVGRPLRPAHDLIVYELH